MTGVIGVDTTFLIDYFYGKSDAVEFMKNYFKLIRISELVIYEFLCGNLTINERDTFLKAIQSFPSVELNREAILISSDIFRKGKQLGTPIGHQDSLIAGSYVASGIKSLVTRNTKHFSKIKEIQTINY